MSNVQFFSSLALTTVLVGTLLAMLRGTISRGDDVRRRLDSISMWMDTIGTRLVDGFGAMQERFADVDRRFTAMDARLNDIDARFDRVDARFDRVDARFDRVEGELRQQRTEWSEQFRGVYTRLDALEVARA